MYFDDILFAVALGLGGTLVLGSALGITELLPEPEIEADASDTGSAGGADGDTGVLGMLGLGRVPLVVVAMLLTLLFGGVGFALSPWLHALFGSGLGPWVSFALAALTSLIGTSVISRFLSRVLPATETYVTSKADLVGREATVLVASTRGDVVLRAIDRGGAELRIRGETRGLDLRVSERVILVAYDKAKDSFEVEKISLG